MIRRSRAVAIAAPVLALALACAWAAPARAFDGERFARRVNAALGSVKLRPEQVSLVIRSTRAGPGSEPLIALLPGEPRIPASNAKLITSYAALRKLSPQFRWKTRFYLTEANDDPARQGRQGLLIVAGGDPLLRRADLDAIAHRLRAAGVTRLDGPLLYDLSVFAGGPYPQAWGAVQGDMPWYAPISALILNQNAAMFQVITQPGPAPEPSAQAAAGGAGTGTAPGGEADTRAEPPQPVIERTGNDRPGWRVQVLPVLPLPGMRVITHFSWITEGRDVVRVRQLPDSQELVFAVSGDLLPVARTYEVATAISDPVGQFIRQFRMALRDAGIEGELAAAPLQGERPPARFIYEYPSAPLADALKLVNKDSNNLVAEVVLRALAFERKPSGVTEDDGLAVVSELLTEDFPEYAERVRLVDGSGLSRDNQVTAEFLVALLERALGRFELQSEFVGSLSMGGMDGTLLDHNLPERFAGRLRAKTGTLRGVQNIAGYFQFGDDLLAFAFLIRDDSRDWSQLQRAQDRALTDILDAYLEEAAPPATARKTLPQLPRTPEPAAPPAAAALSPAPVEAAPPVTPPAAPATAQAAVAPSTNPPGASVAVPAPPVAAEAKPVSNAPHTATSAQAPKQPPPAAVKPEKARVAAKP